MQVDAVHGELELREPVEVCLLLAPVELGGPVLYEVLCTARVCVRLYACRMCGTICVCVRPVCPSPQVESAVHWKDTLVQTKCSVHINKHHVQWPRIKRSEHLTSVTQQHHTPYIFFSQFRYVQALRQ